MVIDQIETAMAALGMGECSRLLQKIIAGT
jgi:hypothetical protein